MENPPLEAATTSQFTSFAFPPHRRRPLRSQTYLSLVRFFSICNDDTERSRSLQSLLEDPIQGNANEVGGSLENHERVDRPEGILVQRENMTSENRKDIDSPEKYCSVEVMDIDGTSNMDVRIDNAVNANDYSVAVVDSFGNEKQGVDVDDPTKNKYMEQYCGAESDMENSGNMEMEVLDKDNVTQKAPDNIKSSLAAKLTAECSNDIEDNEADSYPVKRGLPGDVEQELQHKEMELEKLLSDSCEMNCSVRVTANDEIEEGEFSCDPTVYSQLVELLLEDASLPDKKAVNNVQMSDGNTDKESDKDAEKARIFHNNTNFLSLLDRRGSVMEETLYEKSRNEIEGQKNYGVLACRNTEQAQITKEEAEKYGKQDRQAKDLTNSAVCNENLSQIDKITQENATINQGDTKSDGAVKRKGKKRGPLTKEKKARKKQKERIKRAEKNRKLGVNRLKLKPVSKSKPVAICNHYRLGRCKEGEKCKFSHDTIPLTKSTPCRHFACGSCMKGDNCPFDHQLSNYPCNNILSKGYCCRGANCLFSHEVPVSKDSSTTQTVPLHKCSSSPMLASSNPGNKLNLPSTQKPDGKTYATGVSTCKRTEPSEHILKSTAGVSKGRNSFSPGNSSVGYMVEHKQMDSSKSIDNIEITKRTNVAVPKGINILSFGKSPSDNFNNRKQVNLPLKDSDVGKLPFSNNSQGKLPFSSLDGLSIDKQRGQITSNSGQKLNGVSNRKPPARAPRGVNFLSFGKASSDASLNKRQSELQCNKAVDVQNHADERQTPLDRHEIAKTVPSLLSSFLLSSTQSLGQLANGHVEYVPCSSQVPLMSNTSSTVHKALQSTLACAAKFESGIKIARFFNSPGTGGSENKSK